jgi:hypothetical protein
VGIYIDSYRLDLEGLVVRATTPAREGAFGGRGISHQISGQEQTPSTLRHSLIVDNAELGVAVVDAHVAINGLVVEGTSEAAGFFGDGLAVVSDAAPATAVVENARSRNNKRAGLTSFGARTTVSSSVLACNTIDMSADPLHERPGIIQDAGGNTCGCNAPEVCRALSTNLEPPAAVAPTPVDPAPVDPAQ